MRTIGLLGGMSFEGSAAYYRLINEGIRKRLGGLHSADTIMRSVDFNDIVAMQKSGRWGDAGAYLAKAATGLERGGAACVMICAVTMHLVADAVAQAVTVPLIHIVDETAKRLAAAGCRRPLLIATRYTMENGFYQTRMAAQGTAVMVPNEDDRAVAHAIIFDELCQGRILDASRAAFVAMIEKAKIEGADSVIFGCTEIGLILDPGDLPLPGFDSTAIHADAAIDFALA